MKKQNCVIWIQFHCIHKNNYIYKDIAEDVETRFDTSSYKLDRSLPKEKHHKELIRNNKLILKTQQRFKSERHIFLLKKLIRLL